MRRFLLSVILLLTPALTPAARSQGQAEESLAQPTSKVERKNLAPVSKDVLRVSLPKATEATLSNGLTVLIMENHRLPLVSIQYNISGAGPLFEPANMVGVAGITAQMMRQGTKSRTSPQIADDLARLGASLNVASGFGSSSATI